MNRFFHEFWPQVIAVSFLVGVAGNLVASLLWAVPALTHLHRKLDRQHRQRMTQGDEHHETVMAAAMGARQDYAQTIAAISGAAGGGKLKLWKQDGPRPAR